MNILITVGIFPPDIGGPASFVPKISNFLVENGHNVKIICLAEVENNYTEDNLDVINYLRQSAVAVDFGIAQVKTTELCIEALTAEPQ